MNTTEGNIGGEEQFEGRGTIDYFPRHGNAESVGMWSTTLKAGVGSSEDQRVESASVQTVTGGSSRRGHVQTPRKVGKGAVVRKRPNPSEKRIKYLGKDRFE